MLVFKDFKAQPAAIYRNPEGDTITVVERDMGYDVQVQSAEYGDESQGFFTNGEDAQRWVEGWFGID